MSDDSFFREVNEDLRSERLKSLWDRYGLILIAVVLVIVGATAAWRGYEYYQQRQAAESGDIFLRATTLLESGQTEEARAALERLETEGHGAYPVLARMRSAAMMADGANAEAAIESFREIGADGSVPPAIRDVAKLRAGYLLVDHGSYDDVLAEVNALTTESSAMRHSAREALGLAAWKAQDIETAREWFTAIAEDDMAPAGVAERAEIMLDLIAAYDPDGATGAPPPQAGDAAAPQAPLMLEEIAPSLSTGSGMGTGDGAASGDGADGAETMPAGEPAPEGAPEPTAEPTPEPTAEPAPEPAGDAATTAPAPSGEPSAEGEPAAGEPEDPS